MSLMRKTASMNTPARKRLRSRFLDAGKIHFRASTPTEQCELISFIVSTDTGAVDATVNEPQPTTSQSGKHVTTRPRTRSTTKRTNNTPQTKQKSAVTSEPESVPFHQSPPVIPPIHAVSNERELDAGPAVDPSTPVAKRKAPRLSRQGTRSSVRLRRQNSTATHEPTPIEPEINQTKRKRESDDEGNTVGLPMKRAKRANEQTDDPAQVGSTAISSSQVTGLAPGDENVIVDHLEQSSNFVAEEGMVAGPSKDESSDSRSFFSRIEDLRIVFGLGDSGS
ncbi:hypothetical protein BDM02DRAFT_3116737 [Thelephora ganbajun]|uniref:Uncharacterized protein n=1 Tax=Thelephora ganbajun TaxID=370292 RepID=A0ACB6ZCZ7_THEGA|nr:hypothetical protein BDM02DRAFT_3116737 [Thelephora ganbajun]